MVWPSAAAVDPAVVMSCPKPPSRTFISDRFIALHMIRVRIRPDAPTSDPLMIKPVLSSTKPVAQAANPE